MRLLIDWEGRTHLLRDSSKTNFATTPRDFQGIPVRIENPAGSIRRGTKPDGTPWQVKMTHPYGFIANTSGFDQEAVDCFVGPNPQASSVYIIRTKEPSTNALDEDKVILGASSPEEAQQIFLDNYDDPNYFAGMTEMSLDDFKQWVGHANLAPQKLDERRSARPTLYLVRHAHVEDNGTDDPLSQKVRGSRDIAPDVQGMDEAARVGKEFEGVPVAKIYTSGKQRARVVADAVAKATGAPVEVDPAAESWNRGELEGKPVSDVRDRMQHYAENPDEKVPGGESRNAFLSRYSTDLKAKMDEAGKSSKPIVYVTHLSNILATPAVVTGDSDLLPFPSDKLRTCEMLILQKRGDNWTWKKFAHLADRLHPLDAAGHKKQLEQTALQVATLLRDTLPGTSLLAADVLRAQGPALARLPFDDRLASTLRKTLEPAYSYGRNAVYSEREKATGCKCAPPHTSDGAPAPAAPVNGGVGADLDSLVRSSVFNFSTWVISREMAGMDSTEEPEEDDFNLEHNLLRAALDAAGLPVQQLARELAHTALSTGRQVAIAEMKDAVVSVQLENGVAVPEFEV